MVIAPPRSATETTERAQRAVAEFRTLQPTLSAFARILTRNPKVTVEMSSNSNGHTNGHRIFMRPPLEMGDRSYKNHNRDSCDRRDGNGLQICTACAVREHVMALTYHEIAHIAFDSIGLAERPDFKTVGDAIWAAFPKKQADRIVTSIMSEGPLKSWLDPSRHIHPAFGLLLNCLEDVRINARMADARPGTRGMAEALITEVGIGGVETPDGSRIHWRDMPLNHQIAVAALLSAEKYPAPADWFTDEVNATVAWPEVAAILDRAQPSPSVRSTFTLTVELFAQLKSMGYFAMDDDETPEEDEDEASSEPADDAGASEPEASDDSEGGGDDDATDEGAAEESDSGDGEADDSDADSEPSDADDAGDADASDEADADLSSDDDGGDAGDDLDGSDAVDASGSDEGEEEAGQDSPGSSDADGEEDLSDGEGDSDADQSGSGSSSESSDSDADASEDAGDDGGESSGSLAEGEHDSTPADNAGDLGESGESEADDDSSDGDGSASELASTDELDEDALDYQPNNENGGVRVDESDPMPHVETEPEDGEEPPSLVDMGLHPDEVKTSRAEDEAIDQALIQGLYFETPSANIVGVNVWKPKNTDIDRHDRPYHAWGPLDRYDRRYGTGGIEEVGNESLGPALMRMRLVFDDNKRTQRNRNLKSGRIVNRTLGKRAPFGDDRLFGRKVIPGKKDYAVVIGIDISASTRGVNIKMAKEAALAQGDLLHRMGIKFAVYAHSGSPISGQYTTTNLSLDIYECKSFDAPWGETERSAVKTLKPCASNLDGHTIEYYRKLLDRRTETDKILMYYSDGAMPAENHDEELVILRREIQTCKSKGYTLMAVGINTDSPIRHGLDTVKIDSSRDVRKVVDHLEKRLSV